MKKFVCTFSILFLIGIRIFSQSTVLEEAPFGFEIDVDAVRISLLNVSKVNSGSDGRTQALESGVILSFPMPDGNFVNYRLLEAPVLSDEMAKDHPEIKTYKAFSTNGKSVGRITISNAGLSGFFLSEKGQVIIHPVNVSNGFYESKYENPEGVLEHCEVDDILGNKERKGRVDQIQNFSNGSILKTYRIAIATTGEFFSGNGSNQTDALTEVVNTIGALSTLYEAEVGITFTLVASKIYEDSGTDPFDPSANDRTTQAYLTFAGLNSSDPTNFAYANYDIGHVLHYSSGGGGVASTQVVCSSNATKARGWSGVSPTYRATLYHEVAHQFSALHTFNSVSSGCNGNITTSSAYEPGSGSTMMSYWGSCSPENISGGNAFSRSYFHTNSLEAIISFSTNTALCFASSASGNTPPVVNANPSGNPINIPKGTPFTLTGSGSDANSEAILFNWEQYDLGSTRGGADDAANTTDSPIFRSFDPSFTGNVRTFPALASILSNDLVTNDEALPQVTRTLTMRLTGRDNNGTSGGTHSVAVSINVANSGPFQITSQNSYELWFQGETKTVTWDVNNTNQAPVSCSNVNILISTDGGSAFSTLLAATPNDGIQNITVPNTPSSQVRIKVESVGNIFFDINNADIDIISGSCSPEVSQIFDTTPVIENVGSANLALSLISHAGAISTFSGDISNTDNPGNMVYSNGGACSAANTSYLDIYAFVIGTATSVSFGQTSGTLSSNALNIYTESFSTGNICANWVSSNRYLCGSAACTNGVVVADLSPGIHILTIAGFNSGNLGSYTVTGNNGVIYAKVPALNSPYAFTYLIYNTGSGLIVGFAESPDLSVYPVGNYRIYGLSYATGFNLSPYVNTSFLGFQSALGNESVCGLLGSNYKQITINGPCPNTLTLSSTADDISSGIQIFQTSSTASPGLISATNDIIGGNVTYDAGKKVEMNPGFSVNAGVGNAAVFLAQVGGCN